jgi:two-component system cell cycle response regulator CtrA
MRIGIYAFSKSQLPKIASTDQKSAKITLNWKLIYSYGGMDEPELKIIDVFICKLRKKLANASSGKNYIETVWGRGYVLREPTEAEERIPA